MNNDRNFNDLFADYRSLTPDQWNARKNQIIRRAKDERDRVIRAAFAALFSWLRNTAAKAWAAVFACKHPVFPSRGM